MGLKFDHLTREELDHQLSPSRSAKDAMGVLNRHVAMTQSALDADDCVVRRDIAYGPAPEQCFDVITPSGTGPFPCLVFIHGGFWQEGSKAGSGFAAKELVQNGWACALIGYRLTPKASLTQIVADIGEAVVALSVACPDLNIDPGAIVLAGHSAGGHLTAATICGLAGSQAATAIAGAVLISGVFDLAPIAASYVNDLARISDPEVAALSLLHARPVKDIPIHMLIGADEPAAFQEQTQYLRAAWADARVTVDTPKGRDHFDVLDELIDPASPTFRQIVKMVS